MTFPFWSTEATSLLLDDHITVLSDALPGCTSAGETEAEALQGIREAILLYLEPEPITLADGASLCEVAV